MSRYFNENSLAHSGVIGMKWGVRRYQNKDGTLINKGKRKIGKSINSFKKSIRRNIKNRKEVSKIKKSRKQAYKNRYLLSDSDLNAMTSRYAKEKQFRDLANEDLRPGRTFVAKVLTNEGTKAFSNVVQSSTKKVLTKVSGMDN